ncbi:hypothetical protein TPY_1751 [Sulfobacillus acidophilus TPY]|uniref:Uncharacterized protein n=1 Tax=Sulfobacillus acidophilus (strain ATCC 700253 / DSM 10332 / NAL) TaxID=679936 RepID=G8U1C5_SULAD|nr:hypothetical protein TPY_1751 [Sulfobacillus acidophilus TPY]AEW05445.1 hypothetical protein Sulac_1954 [Sulfobacillus acidophilus DSM 10332]
MWRYGPRVIAAGTLLAVGLTGLAGCGPAAPIAGSPAHSPLTGIPHTAYPPVNRALQWVRQRTAMPLAAPTIWPAFTISSTAEAVASHVVTSGAGFFLPASAYSITVDFDNGSASWTFGGAQWRPRQGPTPLAMPMGVLTPTVYGAFGGVAGQQPQTVLVGRVYTAVWPDAAVTNMGPWIVEVRGGSASQEIAVTRILIHALEQAPRGWVHHTGLVAVDLSQNLLEISWTQGTMTWFIYGGVDGSTADAAHGIPQAITIAASFRSS